MKTTITINGKSYASAGDVPSQYQHLVRDDNGDGIPDAFEDLVAEAKRTGKAAKKTTVEVETHTTHQMETAQPTKPFKFSTSVSQELKIKLLMIATFFGVCVYVLLRAK